MVGKAVATMVYETTISDKGGSTENVTHLIQGSQKDATHKAREHYPETVLREDLLFIVLPRRPSFAFLRHTRQSRHRHRFVMVMGIDSSIWIGRVSGIARHG
jgi:hypothetical protein